MKYRLMRAGLWAPGLDVAEALVYLDRLGSETAAPGETFGSES